MQGYRTPQVAKLTGINPKTLHYWAKSGFLAPSVADAHGTGSRRVFSFGDLVALRVARQLRQSGVSLQALRKVIEHLHKHPDLARPIAETYLVTDGRDVYTRKGNQLISALREPGQGLLFHVVDLGRTVDELNAEIKKNEEPPAKKRAGASCRAG